MKMLIAVGVVIAGLSAPVFAQAETQKPRPWTVLIYGAADNNADGPILRFLDSVRQAIDDDPGLDVLLFIDRSERFSKDARSLGEDFTGARLYRLRRDTAERLSGGAQFPELTLDADAELDSADAGTLGRFIAWGKATSPAQRYALLIYSHADGRTLCPDEHSRTDMGIAELSAELKAELSVDFLALELCNMGGIEIAYQWRPGGDGFGADVLLAIPNAGPPLDWDRAFARIRTPGHDSPSPRPPLIPAEMTAADFGSLVIEEGERGRRARRGEGPSSESAGCYDLRVAGEVKAAVDAMSRALGQSESNRVFLDLRDAPPAGPDRSAATPAARAAFNYSGRGPYVDLYDLCERAAGCAELTPEARGAATAALDAVDRFVIASFGMDAYTDFKPGKNGVFIVCPPRDAGAWERFAWYTPSAGKGRDYGRWAFLADGAAAGNGAIENWFELLDAWLDAPGEDGGVNAYRP